MISLMVKEDDVEASNIFEEGWHGTARDGKSEKNGGISQSSVAVGEEGMCSEGQRSHDGEKGKKLREQKTGEGDHSPPYVTAGLETLGGSSSPTPTITICPPPHTQGDDVTFSRGGGRERNIQRHITEEH